MTANAPEIALLGVADQVAGCRVVSAPADPGAVHGGILAWWGY
ncbi:hypothetical protein [Mycobacterium tuberculosis]|nr:hypothetical protein [Mycobacterium tuberculosis]